MVSKHVEFKFINDFLSDVLHELILRFEYEKILREIHCSIRVGKNLFSKALGIFQKRFYFISKL